MVESDPPRGLQRDRRETEIAPAPGENNYVRGSVDLGEGGGRAAFSQSEGGLSMKLQATIRLRLGALLEAREAA